jgi:hypothetical protein
MLFSLTTHSEDIGLNDIITLTKNNVTNTIIKLYVDTSTNRFSLNVTNIVFLKQNGVADDIIIHILTSEKSKEKPVNKSFNADVESYINRELTKLNMLLNNTDIESYDFFKKHYLLPRAMQYSYQLTNKFGK